MCHYKYCYVYLYEQEKALNTIKMMKGRDITYQFQVINTMYYRAKSVLKRTKNATKQSSIQEAIDTFEPWLIDYKENGRKSEMLSHLKLSLMQKFEPLADYYKIDKSYFNLYTKIQGDPKALRISSVPKDLIDDNHNKKSKSTTWDIYRNQKLLTLKQEWENSDDDKLYHEDDSELKGLPTLIHMKMIMFGYTPHDKKKLTKAAKIKIPSC